MSQPFTLAGYRTIIVMVITFAIGLVGHHLPPEVIQAYAGDVIQMVAILGIVLRLITKTPFGQQEIAKIEAAGVPVDAVAQILGALPQQADITLLLSKFEDLKEQIAEPPVAAVPVAPQEVAPQAVASQEVAPQEGLTP